jgi:hypothetical protein
VFSLASVQGTVSIRSQAKVFLDAFARRIQSGLLTGAPARRNRYAITRQAADNLGFRAVDGWTAYNVGLNEVELTAGPQGSVRYQVRYPRWAGFVVVGGAVLFGLLAVTFLFLNMPAYIAEHRFSQVPGLTIDQNVAVAWGIALFFGFVWPWVLIVLHKPPLRRLMEQVIAEVDAAAH